MMFIESSANLSSIISQECSQHESRRTVEIGEALQILKEKGVVILQDCVNASSLAHCEKAIHQITNAIMEAMMIATTAEGGEGEATAGNITREEQKQSNGSKAFDKVRIDTKGLGVVRMAKIGAGKKNVHFDPYGASAAHEAMSQLAIDAGIFRLVRDYCGEGCTLAETGLSMTQPGGGGLEWHADGMEGECTVIMALEDLSKELGTLGLVLGSHVMLDRDTCEDFDDEILQVVERKQAAQAHYAYRRGQPVIFDARVLHFAEGSQSTDTYRVILWWIYNLQS